MDAVQAEVSPCTTPASVLLAVPRQGFAAPLRALDP